MSQQIKKQYVIHGKVQNVGFREYILGMARTHRINGFVRNQDDGTVEVVAEGEPDDLVAFKRELSDGPAPVQVDSIDETTHQPTGMFAGFHIEF